jgi:hypothetical protein
MAARGHMTTPLKKISKFVFSHSYISWSCYGSEERIITLLNFLQHGLKPAVVKFPEKCPSTMAARGCSTERVKMLQQKYPLNGVFYHFIIVCSIEELIVTSEIQGGLTKNAISSSHTPLNFTKNYSVSQKYSGTVKIGLHVCVLTE